ncbi:MAG: ferrous iron transport protein A [Sideroxydans sp.]|nr:ferrous iron transport protein A [Sideroxydans sp.]NOT99083.1 ferrous iron transport protein A [Sideroxydans sp.]
MKINECAKRFQIQTSVFQHGGDNRNDATCNHGVPNLFRERAFYPIRLIICPQARQLWNNPITVNANDFNPHTPLSSLAIGTVATITDIHTDDALRQRLQALGFRMGKPIEIIRKARFNGPVQVRVGTTDVMLRLSEAAKIEVRTA